MDDRFSANRFGWSLTQGLVAAAVVLFGIPVEAAQLQLLRGHVPPLAARRQPISRLSPARQLDLARKLHKAGLLSSEGLKAVERKER